MLWGDSQTAWALRSARSSCTNQGLGLDTALRHLVPNVPAPRIEFTPATVQLGVVAPNDTTAVPLRVTNHGSGSALLDITTSAWATVRPEQVALRPGEATVVSLGVVVYAQYGLGSLADRLTMQSQHGALYHTPLSVQVVLRAPDGAVLTSIAELVAWCVADWNAATQWFSEINQASLRKQLHTLLPNPGDLARATGRNHYHQKDLALDALLTTLSPNGYALIDRQLTADPASLDLKTLRKKPQLLIITNTGQRYIKGRLDLPRWLESTPDHVALGSGAAIELPVKLNKFKLPLRTRTVVVTIANDAGSVLTVPVVGQLSTWRRVGLRYRRSLLVIGAIALILIATGGRLEYAFSQVQHYRAGVAALEAADYPAARQEFEHILHEDSDYRDVDQLWNESYYRAGVAALEAADYPAARQEFRRVLEREEYRNARELLGESYYRPFVQAVEAKQWDEAADLAVQLEVVSLHYRDLPTIVEVTLELVDRMTSLRWQQGNAQRVDEIRDVQNMYFVLGKWALFYETDDAFVVRDLDTDVQQRLPKDVGQQYNDALVSPDGTFVVTERSSTSGNSTTKEYCYRHRYNTQSFAFWQSTCVQPRQPVYLQPTKSNAMAHKRWRSGANI